MSWSSIIRNGALLVATQTILPIPAMAGSTRPVHLFGPPPAWEKYRQIAEASISATLFDPQSAQIAWMGQYTKGWFKPFLSPRIEGYYACGIINARNRLGGYVGAHVFVVVIDYDRVLYSEIDTSTSGAATSQCVRAQEDGVFPSMPGSDSPKTAFATDGSTPTTMSTATGLTLRAMPDGAYISSIAPGSTAAGAGLKPGMVIGSVNAIPLLGMGDAMLKVIDAAGGAAKVTIIGGGTIDLGAKP